MRRIFTSIWYFSLMTVSLLLPAFLLVAFIIAIGLAARLFK
jgi:hypothetical protein